MYSWSSALLNKKKCKNVKVIFLHLKGEEVFESGKSVNEGKNYLLVEYFEGNISVVASHRCHNLCLLLTGKVVA